MFHRRLRYRNRWHWAGVVVTALMASCATPTPPPEPPKAIASATPAPVTPKTVLEPTVQSPERVPIQPVVPPVSAVPPAKVVPFANPAPARPAPAPPSALPAPVAPSAIAVPAIGSVIPAPDAPTVITAAAAPSTASVPFALPAPAVPPVVVAAAAPSANNAVLSYVANPREYRRDAAKHLYGQNAHRIYKGKLPAMLYAIGVLQVEVDGRGQVIRLNWMRTPTHAPEVVAEIERTVRRAAPFPVPAHLGQVTYTDTWLWHKSGRFQLDTLTEGQL